LGRSGASVTARLDGSAVVGPDGSAVARLDRSGAVGFGEAAGFTASSLGFTCTLPQPELRRVVVVVLSSVRVGASDVSAALAAGVVS
jgi:hypothetical protein